MVTDYLVGFGVASISITVVMEFVGPILLLCVLGTLTSLTLVFFVGRKLFLTSGLSALFSCSAGPPAWWPSVSLCCASWTRGPRAAL